MASTEAQKRATIKYKLKAYDRIYLQVKTGEKQKIESHAQKQNESLNGFITRSINETMERDNDKQNQEQ